MTVRAQIARSAALVLLMLAGVGHATAQQDAFDEPLPRRVRPVRRPVGPPPPVAPPALVSGYLPRNNAVPLYNEPPRIRSGLLPR